ncbi:Bax inhibitor-1/YccA family protein [Bacillus cereus]|uniref:Bax inhibitor-1/YccA family protein n=1 Tax=Bacillus cereus TaxID=1396 RepID=A0A5B9I3B3_BACCE|nr:Bax inhibitor-1/YccA family protein [Bacillus cereus]MDA2439899.1 Bax inhibitor-1/YccA family protein [Bacillus cereus]MDA2445932.1 Bax inhibitor-1/YccA family protein [Bacillus cereus]QEF20130.1 Bax inhibitor-1/YccA family protein [Bacillus cereus]
MRTSNPMLKKDKFHEEKTNASTMTIGGTIGKTFIMLILLLASSIYSYLQMMQGSMKTSVLIGVAIVNIVVAFLAIFIPRISPICAPIYAVVKGIVLGSISAYYTMRFGNSILLTAVLLTISILFAMLVLYATRIIKVTEKFRTVLTAATLGILIMYLIVFLLNTFVLTVPYIHQGGTISIIISAVVIVVAALNLLLDFDSIENGAHSGAAKHMEWYSAIGLMMTLVWLYLEILRFVSYFMKNEE